MRPGATTSTATARKTLHHELTENPKNLKTQIAILEERGEGSLCRELEQPSGQGY
ncbi:hypothetical protein LR48_Vigan07g248000 [Vigna angularis]|uniref:Uncharacterized protein n=1 Tax=Phaseolus angularis TaxID=3914 RepID=A0A0L9V1E2_PHAAN|nr:hypothetical protein LR48_Vigan07g248000 [Vigna angularis]